MGGLLGVEFYVSHSKPVYNATVRYLDQNETDAEIVNGDMGLIPLYTEYGKSQWSFVPIQSGPPDRVYPVIAGVVGGEPVYSPWPPPRDPLTGAPLIESAGYFIACGDPNGVYLLVYRYDPDTMRLVKVYEENASYGPTGPGITYRAEGYKAVCTGEGVVWLYAGAIMYQGDNRRFDAVGLYPLRLPRPNVSEGDTLFLVSWTGMDIATLHEAGEGLAVQLFPPDWIYTVGKYSTPLYPDMELPDPLSSAKNKTFNVASYEWKLRPLVARGTGGYLVRLAGWLVVDGDGRVELDMGRSLPVVLLYREIP